MQVVVKTPHIEITGEVIPDKLIDFLKKEYGNNVIIDSDDYINVIDTDWFEAINEKTSPGDVVKIYRQNSGYTQKELGHLLGGLSRQYISDIENNRRGVSKELALKISKLFSIPVERLL